MQHATHTQISQIPHTCLQEIQIGLTAALLDIQIFFMRIIQNIISVF